MNEVETPLDVERDQEGREFIDYNTSMITDEDPPRGLSFQLIDFGVTTPYKMTGVTLHSHIRHTEPVMLYGVVSLDRFAGAETRGSAGVASAGGDVHVQGYLTYKKTLPLGPYRRRT